MKHLHRLLLCICLLASASGGALYAQADLRTRDVVTGLTIPWEIIWGPDNWIWFTERNGRVNRVNPETGALHWIFTVPGVYIAGEYGLLGMALHPNFKDSAHVFVAYAYPTTISSTTQLERIVRYTYDGTVLVDPKVLVDSIPLYNGTHGGCRLLITPDRKLLATLGEGGRPTWVQTTNTLNGKMIRINLDGTAPPDNPWSDRPYPQNIFWTTGHRNPQGLVFGPTGILYSSEHGPDRDDEINIITKGRNYGWPNVTGKCDLPAELPYCTDWNVKEPIMQWTPTLAVTGIDYYNNDAIPEWKNSLLMTTLKESEFRVLKLSADGMRIDTQMVYFDDTFGRLRDVCIAPDGRVFICTSNKDIFGTPRTGDDRIIEIRNMNVPALGEVVASRTMYTAGDTALLTFQAAGKYPSGNAFVAQLSDSAGTFATSREIGRVTSFGSNGKGSIVSQIPCDITPSGHYRIRVITLSPVLSSIYSNTIAINGRAPIAITLGGSNHICLGDSTMLSVPAGYRSYLWSNGATTRSIVVRDSGTYSAMVTDIGNCVTVTPGVRVQVKGPAGELAISAGSATNFCAGDSVMLAATDGYAGYLWSTGESTKSITVKEAGIYGVRVRDAEGCSFAIAPTAVTVHPLPHPVASYSGGILNAGAEYTGYQWSNDDGVIAGATSREYTPAKSGNYKVMVTSVDGCAGTSEPVAVVIQEMSAPREDGTDMAIALAPQPARDVVRLTVSGSGTGSIRISIVDMSGTSVMSLTDRKSGHAYSRDISLKGLSSGAYVVHITSGGREWTEKLVKE